jgi:putative Mg2+ transporter-C (MgtC) family protein
VEPISADTLRAYWSAPEVAANAVIFANLAGALVLGFIVGYERTYHGRAAGMRTYGLVCMASAALTVVSGYSDFWFGGAAHHSEAVTTQVIQGIVTGVGFLGAGVILKEGFNISGLTTAASIWASSSIGVLVGVGFYGAAILLALLSSACMMYAGRIEQALPSRPAVSVTLRMSRTSEPSLESIGIEAARCGYEIAIGTLNIQEQLDHQEWRFVVVARERRTMDPLPRLAAILRAVDGVQALQLSPARN